jgi:hypothetical protein
MRTVLQAIMILMMLAGVLTMPLAVFAMEDSSDDATVQTENENPKASKTKSNNGKAIGKVKQIKVVPYKEEIQALDKEIESLQEQYDAALDAGNEVLVAGLEVQISGKQSDLEALRILKEAEKLSWKGEKDVLEAEKDVLEALKEGVEADLEALEVDLIAAEESGDEAAAEALKLQIQDKVAERNAYKQQMKDKILGMKTVMKGLYTLEEIQALEDLGETLGEQEGINVLPFNNVFVKNGSVKFDTPPVIKDGRLLIPLRALSTATGADVSWNEDTGEITIVKDGNIIVLALGATTMTVNDEVRLLDVPAELMNRRTVVPIRFIVENLDLEVNWDSDTQTVEVDAGMAEAV